MEERVFKWLQVTLGAHWELFANACSAGWHSVWEKSVLVIDFTSVWRPSHLPLLQRRQGWLVVRKQKWGSNPRDKWGTVKSKPVRVHRGMKAVCLCGKSAERCLSNIFQDLSFFFFFFQNPIQGNVTQRPCYSNCFTNVASLFRGNISI